jgi:acyl dehydratase
MSQIHYLPLTPGFFAILVGIFVIVLSMSMAIGLMAQQNLIDGTALGLLGLQWDFKGPVRIGDTIHAVVTPVQNDRRRSQGAGLSPCNSR